MPNKKPKRTKMPNKKPNKESSDDLSSLAAKILKGKVATRKEIEMLAGSVLGQDVTKGKRKDK